MPSTQEVRLPAVMNERLLQIPDYQRPYAWRRKQLEDLWEDLDLLGPTGSHYAGTLVLRDVLAVDGSAKTSVSDDGATLRHCEVVDGQQRLITCLLLLDRVRRRLNVLAGQQVAYAVDVATRIRTTYGMVSVDNAQIPRLQLGAGLNPYWVDISLGDQHFVGLSLIAGQERLRDAAAYFDGKIAALAADDGVIEFERLKDLQRRVTAGLGFLVYEVRSVAEVGVIFETLNERGRALSDLEKTKNYLLYLARSIKDGRGEQLAELINASWADIFKNLAGEVGDADDQLLRAHWLATQNPDRRAWKRIASIKQRFDRSQYISGETRIVPVTKADKDQDDAWDRLFADLTGYVTGLRHCSFFLSEMFDTKAAFESFTSHKEDARRRSDALFRSGVVALYRPLLFAARLRYPDDGELYARLVDICERYSARVFVIRQRRANAGEARLLRLAHDLFQGSDPEEVLKEVAAALWRYASDAEVLETMESTRENWYSRRGHKYFLYEYELSIKAHGQELQPLSYFTDATKEQRTTEHVLPQHPNVDDACWWGQFSKEQHAALVHSLGNLALTYDNSSYSNKCFDKKRGMPLSPENPEVKCYAQATLKQEQLLAQFENWTPEVIEKRQKQLAAWAMQRWSVEPPTAEEIAQDDVEIEHEGTDEDLEADSVGDIQGGDPGNLDDPGAAAGVVGTDLPTAVDDGVIENW
jgi:Protein of unknown function DUF262/Protein of unknown function (DUF1524)